MDRTFLAGVLGVAAGCAGTIFVSTLAQVLWQPTDSQLTVPQSGLVVASSSPPVRLLIPSLNIDAAVQEVGVTARGNMGVPSNYTDVGWYRWGPAPGAKGSAVIDGHVDNGFGLSGVFKKLSELQKGDSVYVTTREQVTLHFVVTGIERYPYESAPTELVFSRQDKARLNLITCEGRWVAADKTYNQRLVVYTELAEAL